MKLGEGFLLKLCLVFFKGSASVHFSGQSSNIEHNDRYLCGVRHFLRFISILISATFICIFASFMVAFGLLTVADKE